MWMDLRFEWRSALISGLSLCLLCRCSASWLAVLAAGIAIGSKFALRWRGKHLFNPTNIALVLLMLVSDGRVWVSPGELAEEILIDLII
jgi:Na+-transporting NADH:ubiquinone oxidoreductase subunit NqrB